MTDKVLTLIDDRAGDIAQLTADLIRALEDESVCGRERVVLIKALTATLRPLLQAYALLTEQDQAAMAAE